MITRDTLDAIFDTYLSDWNNKFISVLNPPNSRECFDSIVKFTDMIGIPHYSNNPSPFPYANAKDIYDKFDVWQAQWFDRIPNTPNAVPIKGDIVVWNGNYNGVLGFGPGHTGVATGSGTTDWFECFEQNDPLGTPAHLRTYNYNNVSGWLRPKVTSSQPTPPMDNEANIRTKASFADKIINALEGPEVNSDIYINGLIAQGREEAYIQEQVYRKNAKGILDALARQTGFTGDTNALELEDYQLMFKQYYDKGTSTKESIKAAISILQKEL